MATVFINVSGEVLRGRERELQWHIGCNDDSTNYVHEISPESIICMTSTACPIAWGLNPMLAWHARDHSSSLGAAPQPTRQEMEHTCSV